MPPLRIISAVLFLALAGCADLTSPTASPGARGLRIVSWNMEHLAERDGTGCRPRSAADYQALQIFADGLGADVVAFQEVESAAAAQRVFDPTLYDVVIEHGTSVRSGVRMVSSSVPNAPVSQFAKDWLSSGIQT